MFTSSLARRLSLGFASILILLLSVACTGAFSIHLFGKQVRHIVQVSNAKMDLANELEATTKSLSMGVRSVIVFGAYDNALIATEVNNNNEAQESFKKAEAKLIKLVSQGTDSERKLIKEISEAAKIALPEIKEALTLAAGSDTTALFIKMNRVRRAELALKAKTDEFIALQRKQLDAENLAAEALQKKAIAIEIILVILSLAAGIVISWKITKSVVGPIEFAVNVAERIADGDLTTTIRSENSDETGRLLNAIGDMQTKLKDLVGDIRTSADSIKTASSEVASANQDLSSRTERAASDVQETSGAVDLLKGVITNSADSAKNANQLASSAAQTALRGGTVVDEVVRTMEHINDSSRQIQDIISVIDGIAFQTNILALNAAVEAARAGEQGRGFAVVAAEVRNLAQRSASAAKEIKELITNSVEKVALGSRLVDDAGKTMTEIVDSVQEVAATISEITSAASEQSNGINRINQAIISLDDMTQQNSALVEQGAAAAQSLSDQAAQLADAVSIFKLSDELNNDAFVSKSESDSVSEHRTPFQPLLRLSRGFTLIESVLVIVILGILAAVALPRFTNLSDDAANAATQSVAAAITSASSMNRMAKILNKPDAINMTYISNVCANSLAAQLVNGPTFTDTPTNSKEFAITGLAGCWNGGPIGGTEVTCTITGYKGSSQPLKLICSG